MSKKIDYRLPDDFATKYMTPHASWMSPWDKLIGYKEAAHHTGRFDSVLGAAVLQSFRIVCPDYVTRADIMCEAFNEVLGAMGPYLSKVSNVHPFFAGEFLGALAADAGDETNLMCGRVNDFGTYRVEKELDVCNWGICGSELCRSTTSGLNAMCTSIADCNPEGPKMEFNMVEAIGMGNLHCRVVAESREKWPMPEKKRWDMLGPVATGDRIKHTPEEECLKEPHVFRGDSNYTYASGINNELDESMIASGVNLPVSVFNFYPAIALGVEKGIFTMEEFDRVQKCVCEAAGKAAFGEQFAREGLRSYLGFPREIGEDGRLLGAYIEFYLFSRNVTFDIEAFNKEEVIYVIDRDELDAGQPQYNDALISYWYGMSKTLISAQWALWEEDSPKDKLRIKIAKKIDQFC